MLLKLNLTIYRIENHTFGIRAHQDFTCTSVIELSGASEIDQRSLLQIESGTIHLNDTCRILAADP